MTAKARGKSAREHVPPAGHAGWVPAKGRPDPVALLEEQNTTREADLVPVRHGRMMVSPFTFYRGAAKIMAADLKDTPTAGLDVQLCGDAHLSNFGVYASPERELVFDLNDFDETLPGPFEYDVKRMAASFTIAARNNGFSKADGRAATLASVKAYRESMADFAEMRTLDIWYAHLSEQDLLGAMDAAVGSAKGADRKQATTAQKNAEKAATEGTHARQLAGAVEARRARRRSIPDRQPTAGRRSVCATCRRATATRSRSSSRWCTSSSVSTGRRCKTIDASCWSGSSGSTWHARSWASAASARGRSSSCCRVATSRTPCSCRSRKRRTSVLEDHLPKSRYKQPGERVVQGQRRMQAASDIFLGWTKGAEADRFLYWRQLRDMKGSAVVEAMAPATLAFYARVCGGTLARAHARSGDPVALAAYLGTKDKFEESISDFSERYADQNDRDYEAFCDAVRSGRLEAVAGI